MMILSAEPRKATAPLLLAFAWLMLASGFASAELRLDLIKNTMESAGCWIEPVKPKGDNVFGFLDAEKDTRSSSFLKMSISDEPVTVKGPSLATTRKSWTGKGKSGSGTVFTIMMQLGRETKSGEELSWQPAEVTVSADGEQPVTVSAKFWCGS
jgi:hypothetical protein